MNKILIISRVFSSTVFVAKKPNILIISTDYHGWDDLRHS